MIVVEATEEDICRNAERVQFKARSIQGVNNDDEEGALASS